MLSIIRHAFRGIAGQPGFTAVTVGILAISIGANAAIFSVIDALLVKRFPYESSERLVVLRGTNPQRGVEENVSLPDFENFRNESNSFESLAAIRSTRLNFTGGTEPRELKVATVSATLFPTLGINAALGRTFVHEEDKQGANPTVLLTDHLWNSLFASDPGVVGRSIELDGRKHLVVGVLPAHHQFPPGEEADLFVPLARDAKSMPRQARVFPVIGRLKPAIALEAANAEISSLARRLAQEFPNSNMNWDVRLMPFQDYALGSLRPLYFVWAAVALVWLVACINVASLLLHRSVGQRHDVAVRAALGADRLRLLTPLIAESLVFALAGGALGLAFSYGILRFIVRLLPADLVAHLDFSIDLSVIAFTFAISALAAIVFSIVPAIRTSKLDLTRWIQSRGLTAGPKHQLILDSFIVAQIALALVVVVASLLLFSSFRRLEKVDVGFRPENSLALDFRLPPTRYSTPPQRNAFYTDVIDRLEALPGVDSAGTGNHPLMTAWNTFPFGIEGQSDREMKNNPIIGFQMVAGNYFQAIGLPLISGRAFSPLDSQKAPPVAIINAKFAKQYWPDNDALGRKIALDVPQGRRWLTVVGIAGDIKRESLAADAGLEVYLPYQQFQMGDLRLFVRASGGTGTLGAIKQTIHSVDANVPLENIRTMEQVVSDSVWFERMVASLLQVFAAIVLLLVAIGLSGSIAYSVSQRKREMGIRLALGAEHGSLRRALVNRSLRLTLFGVGLGLILCYVISRMMSGLLFATSVTDPQIYLAGVAVMFACALVASYVPAWKSTQLDPVAVLRQE